jgi:uncharacterized phiE125 gp8 family phage protein
MSLKLLTAPTIEPVSLSDARDYLRVIALDEDNLILSLIKGARQWCEEYCNSAFVNQTWELWLDRWPSDNVIKLERPPVSVINSVKYYDTANVEATMSAGDYFANYKSYPANLGLAYGKAWPATSLRPHNGIVVNFTTGYGVNASDVPDSIRTAIKMLTSHFFEMRQPEITGTITSQLDFAFKALLSPYRYMVAK